MRQTIKLFLFIISLFVLTQVNAQQNLSAIPASKLKSMGKNSLQMGDTYSAIEYFEAFCNKKKDPKIMFLLAECYRLARNYPQAKTWYMQTYKADPKNLLSLYYYATMLKTEQNYIEAAKHFKDFRKLYKEESEIDYKKLAKMQEFACDTAPVIIDSALTVTITQLSPSINKASIEFSPMYLNDSTLIFASLRSDTAVYTVSEADIDKIPVRKFYVASATEDNWKYISEWKDGNINQAGVQVGNGAFSPDGKRFYFTRCMQNWKYQTICTLYMSEKKGKKWAEPTALPEIVNNEKYTSTQPTVGSESKKGEEVVYFVSNRPGGKGGYDIWYTIYLTKKKEWREPKNCGNKVNTAGDEVTPYYDNAKRTLYFSSNGWPGLGELDIFSTLGELGKWSDKPSNFGYPVNSSFDDLYFVMHESGKKGIYTSNRPGAVTVMHETCCDDIYAFEYVEYIELAVEGKVYEIENEKVKNIIQGQMIIPKQESTDSINYIEGSIVYLFQIDKGTNEKFYITQDTTDTEGKYFFTIDVNKKYMLEFESHTKPAKTVDVSTVGISKSDTLHIDDVGIQYLSKEPFIIKNIYYEFDKHRLTPEAMRTIDSTLLQILIEVPDIIIEISSHTDSKGEDAYNIELSQRRAQSVVDYLIKKGIPKERLYAKGYGETKPIAANSNPDGTDNPDGRQKNRRTEFRIIGTIDQYSEIIYEE